MKASLLIVLVCLSGCGWLHARKSPPPEPPQLIVTGAPEGSLIYIDGAPRGQAAAGNRTRVLDVVPGEHRLEVRVGDTVVYREGTYVAAGEKRVITVLSGADRH